MTARTLVGVWAHPDDEAYLSAGLMAELRNQGYRVVVATATLGQHGTSDPATWPPERLAARRHDELRASLATLGVHELHVLGYEDGRCAEEDGTTAVAGLLADIRPDVVVTFGPDGMTGHPDHRAVSRWVTDAWAVAGGDAQLWYATLTPEFHDRWGALNDEVGLWADQPEPPLTGPERTWSVTLLDQLADRKVAALEAHASQTGPLIDLVGRERYRQWWRTESFRRPTLAELDSCLLPVGDRSAVPASR